MAEPPAVSEAGVFPVADGRAFAAARTVSKGNAAAYVYAYGADEEEALEALAEAVAEAVGRMAELDLPNLGGTVAGPFRDHPGD